MITVRGYADRDKAEVEKICIETAGEKAADNRRYGELILNMYNRYYTSKSKDYCFVGVDESDSPVGYIICAPDRKAYKRDYFHNQVKAIARINPFSTVIALGEIFLSLPFEKKYPAHLHIDLRDGYRHMGLGSWLMTALCDKLKSEKVRGVMLIVSASNTNAVSFYKKNGFRSIFKTKAFIVMGRDL